MGKRTVHFLMHNWSEILLGIFVLGYITYFSILTVLRYWTLNASYFDLGIMHQTVYNTFMSLKTGDLSRFLEMTNPHGFDQVKRMAVHNDPLLALLAPFYFIHSGPETLLVIQSAMLGAGAIIVYLLGRHIFKGEPNERLVALFFAASYLLYPPVQLSNHFDFHAVVLATPLLLGVYYFFIKRKYVISGVCIMLALLSKEQVGLTLFFFGLYALSRVPSTVHKEKKRLIFFSLLTSLISVIWFMLSMKVIIPYFRSESHFALKYFGDFGDSAGSIFTGLIKNPILFLQYIFRKDTYEYLYQVLGPLGFLSLLSPLHLLIALPEFAINLISKSGAMRNIYFHYTAVLTSFIFISGLYGLKNFLSLFKISKRYAWFFIALFTLCSIYFSYMFSPLPYALRKEIAPFTPISSEQADAYVWQEQLRDPHLKVMATGHLGPLFASRRYFYNFSEHYNLADYIVLSVEEAYNSFEGEKIRVAYEELQKDMRFSLIYKNNNFEVYKKI
ncbi:MAG: DUF2079 domain-containing protein [Microgenomates group bacterium]